MDCISFRKAITSLPQSTMVKPWKKTSNLSSIKRSTELVDQDFSIAQESKQISSNCAPQSSGDEKIKSKPPKNFAEFRRQMLAKKKLQSSESLELPLTSQENKAIKTGKSDSLEFVEIFDVIRI